EKVMERSIELSDARQLQTPGFDEKVAKTEDSERSVRQSTQAVDEKLAELFQDQMPEPVSQASSHLDTALVNQDDAVVDLANRSPEASAGDQEKALDQMRKALVKLTDKENKDQKGNQQKPDQQGEQDPEKQKNDQDQEKQDQQEQQDAKEEQQPPRSETARAIIDEEKENRKRRKQQAASGYKKVEKDW
ncbi:MAG TPA: hypothetical protein VLA34_05795, partial [Candidatus Krumholzibacterium sp.]|nr:hypothetical protein [Candidatus Krumholzibacterium sp.]